MRLYCIETQRAWMFCIQLLLILHFAFRAGDRYYYRSEVDKSSPNDNKNFKNKNLNWIFCLIFANRSVNLMISWFRCRILYILFISQCSYPQCHFLYLNTEIYSFISNWKLLPKKIYLINDYVMAQTGKLNNQPMHKS